ncbi:ParB/RepB/Spo0J family partition protein [Streptomyces sp. ML-6]|uniref:ParB/RepB/Spo0J family partition protein n=1 Tax=Streptomyces sp. ML-6 TaxID=2982693 RepID=UPI0024BF66EE|nr:ParB/RepB/Spo0J family partition protein [Streptomyces sp. ML-6]MDK0524507.1 ParB/RepB/Spo0J family partition protein [Streptomyces sp. ML-6]
MSKADQLGAGRFGGGARPVSARRAAIGAATGVPTERVAPPTRLPVTRINSNPDNPRTTLGDLTELAGSLAEHGQKQAITVMNRDAYVRANPERERDLDPDTTHVVVDGSSRLAAAREAGLTHLNVMVDDEQGSDGDAILESALVANVHRNDLDPLDEARALQRLLAIHGSQVKLAKRLRKSQGWVSQRLALLNLTPELQAVVGEEPVELLRTVAKQPHDRQEAALEELKAERARKEEERAAAAAVPAPAPAPAPAPVLPPEEAREPAAPEPATSAPAASDPEASGPVAPVSALVAAVVPESAPAPSPVPVPAPAQAAAPVVPTSTHSAPVPAPASAAAAAKSEAGEGLRASQPESVSERGESSVPEPRSDSASPTAEAGSGESTSSASRPLPYDDGAFIARHLIHKMGEAEFDRMLDILNTHRRERATS